LWHSLESSLSAPPGPHTISGNLTTLPFSSGKRPTEGRELDRQLQPRVRQQLSHENRIVGSSVPRATEIGTLPRSPSLHGDEVVLAHALEGQECCRAVAGVGDEVGAAWVNGKGVSRTELNLLLGLSEKDADASFEDVERVTDVGVVVPGHLLRRRDL